MLGYRHAFHAGNHADVLKHSVLCWILCATQHKEKGFIYFDTHSGAGIYDLLSAYAMRNQEYQTGITHVLEADQRPGFFNAYVETVLACNADAICRYYPGSPMLARRLLRAQDRMFLAELHSHDYAVLQDLFKGDKQVSAVKQDGLQMLCTRLPPKTRRAVAMIDPSYELAQDYQTVVQMLCKAYRLFASGIYILWYPVLTRSKTERLCEDITATGMRRILRVEVCPHRDNASVGLKGSGLLIVNPPWQLTTELDNALPWLHNALHARGEVRNEWLVPE